MLNNTSGIIKVVLSALFFPMFFQKALMCFAWGAGDPQLLMISKRLFLLLPAGAVLVGCWASIACLLTVPMRQNRQEFITALFITWWDLGKAILAFWGGFFKFLLVMGTAVIGFVRMIVLVVWSIIHDLLLLPIHFLRRIGLSVLRSPVPWIAVTLTLAWCLIEATIFTYVMSPLVIDTFSNITGETMSETFIRLPLFLFLFFIVLGSYAVLSSFVDSFKTKSIASAVRVGAIEIVVLFVEVVFLYREFVDSLVPWFAQYSENFELGVFWTLAIACFVWFGIRSISWFLFAAYGTPTIMAAIQGKGIKNGTRSKPADSHMLEISAEYWNRLKRESSWMREKSEELLGSLMLPPLQVVAAGLNFCTLCVINHHLFSLPFRDMKAIRYSEDLIKNYKHESESLRSEPEIEKITESKALSLDPQKALAKTPPAELFTDDSIHDGSPAESQASVEDA